MKKNIPFIIVYVLALVVTVVNIVYSIKGTIFSDINELPKGKYISSIENEDKTAKINFYRIDNKLGIAVRGELVTNNKTNNIFWQTGIDTVQAGWENNKIVVINGVSIDAVDGGFYDCRRGISLFQPGSIEGGEESNEKE